MVTHSRIKAATTNCHAPRPRSMGGSETAVPSPYSRFRLRKLDCLVVSVVEKPFPFDGRISEGGYEDVGALSEDGVAGRECAGDGGAGVIVSSSMGSTGRVIVVVSLARSAERQKERESVDEGNPQSGELTRRLTSARAGRTVRTAS